MYVCVCVTRALTVSTAVSVFCELVPNACLHMCVCARVLVYLCELEFQTGQDRIAK